MKLKEIPETRTEESKSLEDIINRMTNLDDKLLLPILEKYKFEIYSGVENVPSDNPKTVIKNVIKCICQEYEIESNRELIEKKVSEINFKKITSTYNYIINNKPEGKYKKEILDGAGLNIMMTSGDGILPKDYEAIRKYTKE